jgi:hypothetical protein
MLERERERQRLLQERQLYIQKQQRWLLFLRHCAKCQMSESECQFGRSCRVGKELWQHILSCNETNCQFPRCHSSKDLLKHHQKCQVSSAACAAVSRHALNWRSTGVVPYGHICVAAGTRCCARPCCCGCSYGAPSKGSAMATPSTSYASL